MSALFSFYYCSIVHDFTLVPNLALKRYRLYRESCFVSDGDFVKDLRVLGRNLSEVVIVDNSPRAFGLQGKS